jgi:two-component system, OmpR family, sensor kinase
VFGSLRAKLIASYCLVVVLALVLAGTGFTYVIHAYQTQIRLNQMADLAVPLTLQVRSLQRTGASPGEINQFLQDQSGYLGYRILIVGPDRKVTQDSNKTLVGQTLPLPTEERERPGGTLQYGTLSIDDEPTESFIAMALRTDRPPARSVPTAMDPTAPGTTSSDPTAPATTSAGSPARAVTGPPPPTMGIVLAVPEDSLSSAWLQLAPSLLGAALAALILAIGVAIFLARSIARPLAQVAAASERMAIGDFDQFIPVQGSDEVGHLATSFNTMAREVGQMHRTMRDFLANVSHELRTPLTSIEGFSEAMQDGTIHSSEQYHDAARIIGEEAERMQRLVEDLLYLSKIESGQIDITRSRLDLADLLRSCVRQVQPQTEGAQLQVELDVGALPPVLADGHRLQQVFVNLLDNAVKNTPPAGVITVKASLVADRVARDSNEPPGGKATNLWIAVDVHNSGSYIPPHHAERIFERFYQVDQARAGNGAAGSGLGLAIVQEIVQAHHGKVRVVSIPDRGTTFTVYLPAA